MSPSDSGKKKDQGAEICKSNFNGTESSSEFQAGVSKILIDAANMQTRGNKYLLLRHLALLQ